MPGRRLPWIALLAVACHAIGIARTSLPAQDGLKFLAVARQFQTQPWLDVIRGSDRHPLYPLSIALTEPVAARFVGHGPDSYRLAAQGISSLASVLVLLPLFGLGAALFDAGTATLACLLWVVLPLPAEIGHDTLSDPLALLLLALALHAAERAWTTGRAGAAVGCGLAAGLGYWARPEVAVAAVAACGLAGARWIWCRFGQPLSHGPALTAAGRRPLVPALLGGSFLAMVGLYALAKGEVSEKLALRRAAAIVSEHDAARKPAHWLPPGLDDPRWDFAPKEESSAPRSTGVGRAAGRAFLSWVEATGWLLAPLALWGAVRVRSGPGRWMVGAYAVVFGAVVIRHAAIFGYLSPRHMLGLVIAALPWSAAGLVDALGSVGPRRGRRVVAAVVAAAAILVLAKPSHPSRWGHLQAGRWLARHVAPGEAVLDTRGWAAFVSGCRAYDPWHVRQALGDARLSFIVIGADELSAPSRRAETWRSLLAFAAEPVAAFPAREQGTGRDVLVYRFRRPASWEGLAR
jgi:hypothetical protein